MTKYLDLEGLKKFKAQADAAYLPVKGTIPLTGSINLTTETALSLAAKYAKVANNSLNFYVIADSSGKLPSSETRVNINSSITSLVGAEGANVGDIFVVGKLDLKPVYKVIPLNDAKAENSDYKGTQGVVTPWDKAQINKVPNMESAINAAKNNLPTLTESNMNNALKTGFYPWCTLGRPSGSTGAYTLVTLASTTADNNGYTTIEQTAYGRQNDELGKIFKRIIFKPSSGDTEYGEWKEIDNDIILAKWIPYSDQEYAYAVKSGFYSGELGSALVGDAKYNFLYAKWNNNDLDINDENISGFHICETGMQLIGMNKDQCGSSILMNNDRVFIQYSNDTTSSHFTMATICGIMLNDDGIQLLVNGTSGNIINSIRITKDGFKINDYKLNIDKAVELGILK